MNEELEAFKDELREAGQPWSRNGVRIVGAGILGLFVSQVAPWRTVVVVALLASFAAIMVGWVFLVIAFIKRRQWARAHPLREPSLPDPGSL
jgi:hypothetical protein